MNDIENIDLKFADSPLHEFLPYDPVILKPSSEILNSIRYPEIVERVEHHLLDCDNWITTECSQCGWTSEDPHDPHNIHISCGIRICEKEHCVSLREVVVRQRVEPLITQIKNMYILILTLDYKKYEFNSKKDVEKVWKEVRFLIDKLHRLYGIKNVIANIDVIKKPDGMWHIHFNVFYDGKYIPVSIIRMNWKYRLTLKRKKTNGERRSALNYLVKRVSSINPTSKDGSHIPITVEEYVTLFYKSHFFRCWYWNQKPSILVSFGNMSSHESHYCPMCGSKMLPKIKDHPPPDVVDNGKVSLWETFVGF